VSFAVAVKVDRPVACIIGAGPAGLALGHVLRQACISCVVLERQEADGLRARMKAGMLEHRTVELLRAHGLAQPILERGRRIGTCEFRADGTAFFLDYAALCGGRGHHIYPQQELVADWAEQLLEAGGDIRFGVEAAAVDQREDGTVVRAFVAATGSPVTIDGMPPVEQGELIERDVLDHRVRVCARLQDGRIFAAGDAAHLITPAGGKGMNMAIQDAVELALGISDRYGPAQAPQRLARCTETRLPSIWRHQEFSNLMLSLFNGGDPGFSYGLRRARVNLVVNDPHFSRWFAHAYAGVDD